MKAAWFAALLALAGCRCSVDVSIGPIDAGRPTCATCWSACDDPKDDRAAYWCVRNCTELCAAERDR